jgi:hypothetical protein
MHYILLNITPFLYHLWNGIKLKINNPKTKSKYINRFLKLLFYYLTNIKLKTISSALTKLKS